MSLNWIIHNDFFVIQFFLLHSKNKWQQFQATVVFQTWAQCNKNFCNTSASLCRQCFSRVQVFRWFKAASEGRESVWDEWCHRRLSSLWTDKIRNLVCLDCLLIDRMIGKELNLTHTTGDQILINELRMRNVCVKMVAKPFAGPKNYSRENCLDFLESIKNYLHFLDIVAGVKFWLFKYGPETTHFNVFKAAQKSKNEQVIKFMLIYFFDSHLIVHTEFVLQDQTVN